MFLWRASKELFPIKFNLAKRRIIEKVDYPICAKPRGNTNTCSIEFSVASDVWGDDSSHLQNWQTEFSDAWEW